MSGKIVLFGAGSPLIVDYEETCERLSIEIVAIVRNFDCPDQAIALQKVIDVSDMPPALLELPFALPLFSPANRRSALRHAVSLGASAFDSLVDPTATLPRHIDVASGVFINAGVVLGAASRLAEFSVVNRGAVLGHHMNLGAFASIGPGVVVAGQVTVENDALIGAGATLLPNVRIGHHAVVGAGSVVTRDVPAHTLVVGCPAKFVRTLANS